MPPLLKKLLLIAAMVVVLAPTVQVEAAIDFRPEPRSCTDTRVSARLNGANVFYEGLGLTADQKREVSARLSQYGSSGLAPRPTFEGIGLTPEQLVELQRRVDADIAAAKSYINRYPIGWPCKPFKNMPLVVKFMRAKLIYNGFRPNMRFSSPSTRQLRFVAVQDGYEYYGVVARSGVRQITLVLTCTSDTRNNPCPGGTYTYALKFEA